MDGMINLPKKGKKPDDYEFKPFNPKDVLDLIDMATKEGPVVSAMNLQKRFIMFNNTQVTYGGGEPELLMNMCITEYWNKFIEEAYAWDAVFGIILYRVARRELVVSDAEMTYPEADIISEYTDAEGVRHITVLVPVVVSLDTVLRAQIFKKDDELGVIVLNEEKDAIDMNVRAYMTRPPIWSTASFNSPCACLLGDYRPLQIQKRLFVKCSIEGAFPRLMLTPVKDGPPKVGEPPLDLLEDVQIERIIANPDNHRLYTKGPDPNERKLTEEQLAEVKRQKDLNSLHMQFVKYVRTGIIPEIADSVHLVPKGYTASLMPAATFLGDLNQLSELFDQRVCSAFNVYIGFIRPSIGNRNTLSVNEDNVQYLKDSVAMTATVLAKFSKHVWCTEVYKTHKMHKLVMTIPVSNKMALDEIIKLVEHGFVAHKAATTQVLQSKFIEDEPGVRGKEPEYLSGATTTTKKKKKKKKVVAKKPTTKKRKKASGTTEKPKKKKAKDTEDKEEDKQRKRKKGKDLEDEPASKKSKTGGKETKSGKKNKGDAKIKNATKESANDD